MAGAVELPLLGSSSSQVASSESVQSRVLVPEFQMFSVWFITGFAWPWVAVKLRFGGEKAIIAGGIVPLTVVSSVAARVGEADRSRQVAKSKL